MSTRISNIFAAAALAVSVAAAGCVPIDVSDPDAQGDAATGLDSSSTPDTTVSQDTSTSTDSSDAGSDAGPDASDTVAVNLPVKAEDSCVYDDKGGTCSFFGGEVVLNLATDALGGPQTITLVRDIIQLGGVDLIGYVWGPHGLPIGPPGEVTVTIPTEYAPTNALSLASWTDPNEPQPLLNQSFQEPGDGTYVLKGDLASFETLLIMSP